MHMSNQFLSSSSMCCSIGRKTCYNGENYHIVMLLYSAVNSTVTVSYTLLALLRFSTMMVMCIVTEGITSSLPFPLYSCSCWLYSLYQSPSLSLASGDSRYIHIRKRQFYVLSTIHYKVDPLFNAYTASLLTQTTQAFTDVITDGVVRRWWKGFDVIRRLMYIVLGSVFDLASPDYTQVQYAYLLLTCLRMW